jgi:chaperonin GroEL (HSP60 family)
MNGRLALLVGGSYQGGAATEDEMKEKMHRVEDAEKPLKAAIEEGILPAVGISSA